MPFGPPTHPYDRIVLRGEELFTERVRDCARRLYEYHLENDQWGVNALAYQELAALEDESTTIDRVEATLEALCRELERASEYEAASPLEAALAGEEVYDDKIRALVRERYAEIEADIYQRKNQNVLEEVLWTAGWEPEDPSALEAELRACGERFEFW